MWDMRSDGYTPMLTGQHDWYLIRQLENYKAKVRGLHEADKEGRKMWRETVTLGAGKDIRDVVAYIQTLACTQRAAAAPFPSTPSECPVQH